MWSIVLVFRDGSVEVVRSGLTRRIAWLTWRRCDHSKLDAVVLMWPEAWPIPSDVSLPRAG